VTGRAGVRPRADEVPPPGRGVSGERTVTVGAAREGPITAHRPDGGTPEGAAAPTVSVLTATYNSADLIAETVSSILAQTFGDFEYVIVDDCSTDGTPDVIRGFDDPRIRLYVNERNLGISENRNKGLSLCRGRYVAYTDQDDISAPRRLEAQVAYMDAHPEAVMAAAESDVIRDGRIEIDPPMNMPSHLLHWHLMTKSPIRHSSIMLRRDVLMEHGVVYRKQFPYAEDYDLYHVLMDIGELHVVPEKLLRYRYYGGNASIVKKREMTESGWNFLHEQWRKYLGDTVTYDDIKSVWKMMTEGKPADDLAELDRVGALYERLLHAYLDRHAGRHDEARRHDVHRMASEVWLRAVFRTAKRLGPRALSAYRRHPDIAVVPMPWLQSARMGLQGIVAPR